MNLRIILIGLILLCVIPAWSQINEGTTNGALNRGFGNSSNSSGNPGGGGADSIHFEHRDDAKDSITISFKWFDSLRSVTLDNSIADFYKYFPIPVTQQYLGNNGTAGYSLIFNQPLNAGFDAGFHAFDAYRFTLEGTKFYKTTKPYTQLNYQLASGKEQVIKITHTQNPRPNLNVGFEYRLINAPGTFVTQNTNHNNYRIFSHYQSKRKRYGAQFIWMGNSLNSSENGGIANDSFLTTTSADYSRRFTIPVNLGQAPANDPNPFSTTINTGNKYKDLTIYLKQYYDIGKKDSIIINDSTTEYLFYSKLRFQHTFTYNTQRYEYRDLNVVDSIYNLWYDTTIVGDSLIVHDQWKIIHNDFSLLQFPDTKNLNQYFLAGIRLENMTGKFSTGATRSLYNIVAHGEYRNKTRNKLWDINANGSFYVNGYNSGDYSILASLTRRFNSKWGSVRLAFKNINRSPSYLYTTGSSFNFHNTENYNKENTIMLHASAENAYVNLSATNYLVSNYLYFSNYATTAQYSKLMNILQLSASKSFKLSKHWNWHTEITVQQTDGAGPIRLPLAFTRNRFAYEGVFFKNLNLSTGIEIRYYTPYKANRYSPVMGAFFVQDSVQLQNRPDVHAFMHFRIKSFTGYLRVENLNTASFANGFGFTKNNFAAPQYLYPGMMIRFGIAWVFVN
ncbi:MAG: hypothetical protein RLY16_827 [Bacteroidota bacterium]|jgi:hypothetical protein